MVDWDSSAEITILFQVLDKVAHAFLGLYVWEFLTTFDFEWGLLTGRRKFHWPLVSYFLGRYFQLFGFIGLTIGLDVDSQINCQSVFIFTALMNLGALSFASVNLAIRVAMSLESNRLAKAVVPLLASGQWALVILATSTTKGNFVPSVGCTPTGSDKYTLAFFIYTMCFNLFLLIAVIARRFTRGQLATDRQLIGHNKFIDMIFGDDLMLFVSAFVFTLLAVIFIGLNLNKPMNVMFQIPAATFTTIAGCRAITHLLLPNNRGSAATSRFSAATSSNNRNLTNGNLRDIQSTIQSQPGVHVQMETFTQESLGEKKLGSESVNENDLEANKTVVL